MSGTTPSTLASVSRFTAESSPIVLAVFFFIVFRKNAVLRFNPKTQEFMEKPLVMTLLLLFLIASFVFNAASDTTPLLTIIGMTLFVYTWIMIILRAPPLFSIPTVILVMVAFIADTIVTNANHPDEESLRQFGEDARFWIQMVSLSLFIVAVTFMVGRSGWKTIPSILFHQPMDKVAVQ